jgi:hypothetical protein
MSLGRCGTPLSSRERRTQATKLTRAIRKHAPARRERRREEFNPELAFLHREGEEFLHELVDASAIVRIRWLQAVMVDDEHRLSAPFLPAVGADLIENRSAKLSRDWWLRKRRSFQATPNTSNGRLF